MAEKNQRAETEYFVRLAFLKFQLMVLLNPFFPPLRFRNQVPTFAVRETDVSRHNGANSGAPLKPLRDDSVLRALSSLRGLRGAPEVPPLCRETSVSRTVNVGTWLRKRNGGKNGLTHDLNTFLAFWCYKIEGGYFSSRL